MNNQTKTFSSSSVKLLAQAGLIAALYVVLTVAFAPFSFKEIQVRLAEMLTIMPFFTLAGIPGVTIGCLLGNILSGAALPDIIFGTMATLIGAVFTYYLGRRYESAGQSLSPVPTTKLISGTIPPIVSNALIIPFVIKYAYGSPMPIWLMIITVGVGEVVSCGILGVIFGHAISRLKQF